MSRNDSTPRGSKPHSSWFIRALLSTSLVTIAVTHVCGAQQKSSVPPKKSAAPASKGTSPAGQSVQWSVQSDSAPAAKGPLAVKPVPLQCKDTEAKQVLFAGADAGMAAIVSQADKIFRLERYDLQSGKHLGSVELTNMQNGQELVALSPDGSLAAHVDNKDRLDVLSAADGKSIVAWRPYEDKKAADGKLFWVAFLDSKRLLTANQAGRVDLWNLPETKPAWTIDKASHSAMAFARHQLGIALSPGRRFVAAFNGEGFDFYDAATGGLKGRTSVVRELTKSNPQAKAVAFSPDGKELAAVVDSGGMNGAMLVRWDLTSGESLGGFHVPVAGQLSLQLRPSLRKQEREWQVQGAPVTSLTWWGPKHVLVSDEYLLDLERKWFVWHVKLGGAGAQATTAPDDRLWFASSSKPGASAVLTALAFPMDDVGRAVAAAADAKSATPVRPGAKVSLSLEIDGPATNAESYRDKLTEQFTSQLASHGLTVADGQDIKLVVRTKVVEGDATFEIRTRGKDGSAGSFRAKRLITQTYWADKQGKPLWQDDHTIDPGRIGTSMGPEDPPVAQLNGQWGHAAGQLGLMVPFFLPQPSGSKSADAPLPGDSLLTPDGLKPAPAKKPAPLLEPAGRADRKAA